MLLHANTFTELHGWWKYEITIILALETKDIKLMDIYQLNFGPFIGLVLNLIYA